MPVRRSSVVRNFGSAIGELAACLQSVGLGSRPDLTAWTGAAQSGAAPAPGGVVLGPDGWRCRSVDGRTVTIVKRASPRALNPPSAEPGHVRPKAPPASAHVVLNLLGPRTHHVLVDAGVLDCQRAVRDLTPFLRGYVGDRPVCVLLQTLENALVLVDATDVESIWRELVRCARPHAAATVGIDAVELYLVAERRRRGRLMAI